MNILIKLESINNGLWMYLIKAGLTIDLFLVSNISKLKATQKCPLKRTIVDFNAGYYRLKYY